MRARRFAVPRGLFLAAASASTLFLGACSGDDDSGGSSGSGGTSGDFAVVGSSVLNGATWQLNRPIDVTFNENVDFGTVSLSTIQIVDSQGVPAIGSFTLIQPNVVRFQPVCPTNNTNSNGGLLQGRVYRLTVPSESTPGLGGGVTVQNTSGERLEVGLNLNFNTPQSTDPLQLFVDVVAGAPQVQIVGLNGVTAASGLASYVEFPGQPDPDPTVTGPRRELLTFDPMSQQGTISEPVPLNFYSREDEQFAFVLRFNQPIFAATSNVNSDRIGIEYFNNLSSSWETVPSDVVLLDNCTAAGSSVRLTPRGIVPQGSELRAFVREGFADLTGQRVQSTLTNFARVESGLADPGGPDPDDGSDEILEHFNAGGNEIGSREDLTTTSPNPRANWDDPSNPGVLAASFDFEGTGGPGGDFDWEIPDGQTVLISTDADLIRGGPDFIPTNEQPVIGGIINVRRMRVGVGARLQFIGSNTCTILATESIEIAGQITVNGSDSIGVGTLNTTNTPEFGAAGNAGGGNGGTGSFRTAQSTPRGGDGFGAFQAAGLGGGGGETGYAPPGLCAKQNRRGAGGGGGRFGEDIRYDWMGNFVRCQTLRGMDAEPGFIGSNDGTGAVSGNAPAQGGEIGPDPFLDADETNNFFGTMRTADDRLILGELTRVWAGAGGGAGGDAVQSSQFPLTPFNPLGDEKGAGGGGGAGGLQILAKGDVHVLETGSVVADGGTGGGGENSIFFDRIGGGSGGGSGGHIVISSAGEIRIDAEATAATVGPFYTDDPMASFHEKRPVSALGGVGGAGAEDACGRGTNGVPASWARDAIPQSAFEGDPTIPPQEHPLFLSCNVLTCSSTPYPEGTTPGAGGDGGPGIIQLHVSDPATQLLFGSQPTAVYGVDLDPTFAMAPPPLGWERPTLPTDDMLPFFSARSDAFSEWIPLGLARLNPNGTTDQVEFFFEGTDPTTGVVNRNGTLAEELPPVLAFTALSLGGANPSVDPATGTFTIDGAGVRQEYKQNAALMREFKVTVRDSNNTMSVREYEVQSGTYDDTTDQFTLQVDPGGTALGDFLLGINQPEVEIVPYFLRLRSGGVNDSYPPNTEVRVFFGAVKRNPITGQPSNDPADIFMDPLTGELFTPDITDLNNDVWDFVRFKVEFLIDTDDLESARPAIDYLRIPYTF